MNYETNEFLEENLMDAHNIFNMIINEMQDNNIKYEYEFLKNKENESFHIVCEFLNKMNYLVYEYDDLVKKNEEVFNNEYRIYLKYISLYIVSIVFIRLFYQVFDTSKLNEMLKYIIGIFLGSTYIGLMNKDLNENRNNSKERRDLINRLKTLKEEYSISHNKAVNEIDYMFALNSNLWNELDNSKKIVKNK